MNIKPFVSQPLSENGMKHIALLNHRLAYREVKSLPHRSGILSITEHTLVTRVLQRGLVYDRARRNARVRDCYEERIFVRYVREREALHHRRILLGELRRKVFAPRVRRQK